MIVGNPRLNYCHACGRAEGVVHATLELRLVNHKTERVKLVQFWLCERCERLNRALFENRFGREERIAQALTPEQAWVGWESEG